MSKLWVKFRSNRPTRVPAYTCEIIDDFIKACKKELGLPHYSRELSLSTTDGGIPLERDGPIPPQNTARTPLFLSVDVAEPAPKKVVTMSYGKASMQFISETTGIQKDFKKWEVIPFDTTLEPSPEFVELFKKNCRVFEFDSEASRRTLIDLFLREIVAQFPDFVIICEYHMTVVNEEKGKRLNGKCDYTISHRGHIDLPHLVAVEAKVINKESMIQCVGECASINYRRIHDKMENHSVYGIHSTGSMWKFVYIHNRTVFISDEFQLNTMLYVKDELDMIYRLVYYIVQQTHKNSPRTTPRE